MSGEQKTRVWKVVYSLMCGAMKLQLWNIAMHYSFITLTLITCLIAIAESASDIYAPCLPTICAHFNILEAQASLTMSLNLIGLALSGLIYGPLSDVFGRRKIMIIGWTIFVLASLVATQATTIHELLAYRFLQGFGGGAALVIGLAMISDLYQGPASAKMISRVGMVIALSPGLGPVVGSMIAAHYSWTMVFWVVFASSALLWAVALFALPETKVQNVRASFDIRQLLQSYGRLLGNASYWRFALIQILTIAWLWGELANLPFIFMEGMGLPVHHYGYFMALSVGIYVIGTMVNQRWVGQLGIMKMLKGGIILTLISGLLLGISHGLSLNSPWFILLLKIPGSFGIALIFGNATAKALEYAKQDKGTGSALISACQMIAGSIGIYAVSLFYDGSILPLALAMGICSSGALWALSKTHTA